MLHSGSQFAGQYLLQRLLGSLERPFAQQQYAIGYALSLGLALLLENMSAGWTTWVTQAKLTIPMTALLKGLLFEKMTKKRSSQQAAPQAAKSKDVLSLESLMSNDCASVSQACTSSQHCLKAVFKLLFDVTYLVHLIGLKHIALGSLFPIIIFPISKMLAHQHRLAKLGLSHLHTAFSSEVSELLRSLRQIRLSSMEELWQQRVAESRARELRQIWHCGMILAMLTLATNLGPILLIAASLSSYALQVGHLSPSLAFASIGLFRNLHTVFQELPATVASLQESFAASRRIEKYLHQSTKMRAHDSVDLTTFEDVKITWPNSSIASGSSSSSFSLNNVNLHFPKGRLSIITGKTSSGKGLLLSALLGEADTEAERCNLNFGSVAEKQMKAATPCFAYVSQPPWIENRTIQENIIFGNGFDQDRYTAVLRACALERDLQALPHEDMAMAGVNGGTLSGGQKWRVSLARALYSRAQVLVLDDILSAVDPHVAKWLCQHALSGPLVRGRTVIIATHHLATCVHLASYVVTVDSGTASGRAVTPRRSHGLLNVETMPRSATSSPKPDPLAHSTDVDKKHPANSRRPVLRTFTFYLLGSGPWPVLFAVSTTLACRLLAAGNSWWLTKWTSNKELDVGSLRFSLYIYLTLSVCAAVAVAVHAMAVQGVSLRASEVLFQKTVQSVTCSSLRWIDSLSDLLRIVMQLILVVFTSGVATPQTIAMMVIMMSFYLKITTRHLCVSKRLNKLVPLAAQPILEHTNSAEFGIMTIRAFKKEPIYVKRMYDLLDAEMGLSWHITLGQRWIHGRYGILGSIFVCATAVSLVLAGADAATAGFTINMALQFKATMSGLMGKINLLTSGARAIDRVLDIAEAPTERQSGEDVAASWPASGRLEVKDVTVRYDADLPPVLRGITFSLAAGERLGVVGRTGAGKTSLVNALLRFIDIEEGSIHVDGMDTASLKLASLRSTISVIPQDPFLFSGTLRTNLTIRGPKADEELKAALGKVSMQATDGLDATDLVSDLDMAVQAGGDNLSHGQRQMVCLARAILSPRRIVILDEATSAVDRATDTMVQKVIRREFAESTMIIVAHRLATVADLDKVLVLDEGVAVEIGSPAELMQNKGMFWDMVNQSGDADNFHRKSTICAQLCQTSRLHTTSAQQQDADPARDQKHMHSSGPRLKNGVDLQLQTAFYDQNWSTVVRLADKRAKTVNDPYYEVLKVCAESQLDDPAAKYSAMTALLTYAKDGTVIKDADGIDLLEWATRDLLEEHDFPKTLGLLRVRAAKASPKDKSQTTRCLESCLLHWDLVSAQQIAALIDKSFPQERAFLFWNIAITHLLAISPHSPTEKKKLYGMLAQKQIERAAQATEQAEDKKALPSRSIQTEEEILLLYEIVGTHGTTADFAKLLDSASFSPVEQLKQGRKEPLVYAIKKLQKDQNWQSLFDASDWDVWRHFITAASRIQDCYVQATATVQDLLLKLSKAADSKPMYKRNVMLARVSASFQLLESEHPDAIDSSPSSLRLRELVKYINNQASYPSCFDDIRLFVEQLDPSGIDYLAHHHFLPREPSDDLPELRRQILALKLQYFAATCPQTCITAGTKSERRACRELRFKNVYQASMALHKYINTISSYTSQSTKDVQSEVALVAAFCLVGLADQLPSSLPTTEATQYLVQALLLLQQQLSSSPKHSQISLLLVQLHLRVGSAPEALAVWDTLAVKRTIMDSLAPLFYDRLSTVAPGMTSPLTDAGWQLMASIKTHYQTSLKMRMPRRLIDAFQDGSYSSVLAVPRYVENLRVSCTRAMSLVESVRSERLFGVTDTDFFSDSRFTEVCDDTSMNEIIDYGSFPSWNHSATPAIYERLRLGPAPSNRRAHLSLLAEAFQQTLAYTPPSFYKVPLAGSVADQNYVIESLGQIANSFSKFVPGAASSLTDSELHYFQVVSLLSSLVPLCGDRASGLHELVGQLTSAVTASLDSQRDYLAALASGTGIGHATSLLQSLHRVVLLRDTAVAVRNAAQWIVGFHEKQKERDRSGQSNLPKDVVAQTKALGAAADDALRQCRSWIVRLAQDTKSGGVVEREIKRFVYGGEEGRLLQGVVTDGTVFDLVDYHVIATPRRAEVLEELAAMGMSAVSLDVTSSASIEKCKAQVAEITGGTLDILVNNAPTCLASWPCAGPFFIPLLIPARGLVLQISSISAVAADLFASVYSATKGALDAYSRSLRLELRPFSVRVMVAVTGTVKSRIAANVAQRARGCPRTRSTGRSRTYGPDGHTDVYAASIVAQAVRGEGWMGGWLGGSPDWYWTGGLARRTWLGQYLPTSWTEGLVAALSENDEITKRIHAAQEKTA
ncbi:hypothetical protein MY11210_004785 [Beauveria gryllotalpidicola]